MLQPRSFLASAVALLATTTTLLPGVAAQMTTECQPLEKTCPPNPALAMDLHTNFNVTPHLSAWEVKQGAKEISYDVNTGMALTINKQGDAPTLRSKFYFFWGRTEIWLKAAHGQGIISSVMLLSDDLDEIDWEFRGTYPNEVLTNTYGKGDTTTSQPATHNIPGNVVADYHNYTIDWTKDYMNFFIDGQHVRTLLPKDANNTKGYPQTPMRVHLGIWAGGDPTLPPGTREWAGGDAQYDKGPYTMFVKSTQVTDYSKGKEYVYGDKTGDWQSIKIVEGNSTIKEEILAVPEPTLSEKWDALDSTAKVAIYASAAGVGAILIAVAVFYCIKQRRRGAAEARQAALDAEKERQELNEYRQAGINPDAFVENAAEYNSKEMRQEGLSDTDSYSVPPTPATEVEKFPAGAGAGAAAGAGAGAVAGAAAANALRNNGAQSPRIASPGPNRNPTLPFTDHHSPYSTSPAPSGFRYEDPHSPSPMATGYNQHNNHYNGGMSSPAPHQGMGSPSPVHHQHYPPQRSFTSPAPMISPQQATFDRVGSPQPIAQPQPQRSFTQPPAAGFDFGRQQSPQPPQPAGFDFGVGQQEPGYGNNYGARNDNYGAPNDNYWNNGGGNGGYR